MVSGLILCFFFFFMQKTAYELRISDWSSDVCSSDLQVEQTLRHDPPGIYPQMDFATRDRYRRAVEDLHRGSRLPENQVAQRAIEMASQASRNFRSEERRVGKSVSVRVDLGGRRIIKKKSSSEAYHR